MVLGCHTCVEAHCVWYNEGVMESVRLRRQTKPARGTPPAAYPVATGAVHDTVRAFPMGACHAPA